MTLPLDLKALREKAEKATPGPWHVGTQNDALFITIGKPPAKSNDHPDHGAYRSAIAKVYQSEGAGDATAAHIAASNPSTLLTLIDVAERAVRALEFARTHAPLCNHDDPTWCEDKCRVPWEAKAALAEIRKRVKV